MTSRAFTCACVGAALVAGGLVSTASGTITYGLTVEDFLQGQNKGGGNVAPVRSNPASALGAPQFGGAGTYFSLGFGGHLTLGFGGEFGTSVTVWETTYGNIANHPEQADVFVGWGATAQTATYWFVGTVFNIADGIPMSLDPTNLVSGRSTYNYVKIVDTSNSPLLPLDADGFDVDGVAVGPVPAPASLALLLAAGLTGVRRRR